MEEGAARLRKSVLEMGGSDPAIVCEDADIDIAASGIVWGAFSNCGQNCNGIERVYVHESVADALISRVVEKVQKLRPGEGMEASTDIGPLATEAQFKKIGRIVKQLRSQGGQVLTGGGPLEHRKGYFFEPTVVQLSSEANSFIDEEIFGPLVMITPVRDDDEAVALANRTQFGLASSVWTANRHHGYRIARRIEAGTVMINDCIVSFGMQEAGWTGVKKSGVGWVHGEKGLDEMVNIKFINYDPQMHMQKFWWFPYSGNVQQGMKAGLEFLYDKSLIRRLTAVPETLRHFWKYLLKNSRRREKL